MRKALAVVCRRLVRISRSDGGDEEGPMVRLRSRGISLLALGATAFALVSCASSSVTLTPPPSPSPVPQLQSLNPPASIFPTATRSAPTGIVGTLVTDAVALADGSTIGALYDTASRVWKPLQMPSTASTAPYGPAITTTGYRVVGSYLLSGSPSNHGFVYDSSTNAFTTIDPPADFCAPRACNQTIAHSNYGATSYKAVGNCDSVDGTGPGIGVYPATGHAFLYDSATNGFTRIDVPGSLTSTAYGIWIDGSEVAVSGGFSDGLRTHGYVRGLTSKKAVVFDYPGAVITHFEGITGAGGAGNYNVIGDFEAKSADPTPSGFFLPIRDWHAGTPILIGSGLSANSAFERTVVGITIHGSTTSGYITTVPG